QVPLKTRALYFDESTGKRFLYLSFVVNGTPIGGGGAGMITQPRDLYLGFRPPAPFTSAGTTENSNILQFRLDTHAVAGAPNATPTFCNTDSGCTGNYYRAYVDKGDPASTCTDPGYAGYCSDNNRACSADSNCNSGISCVKVGQCSNNPAIACKAD